MAYVASEGDAVKQPCIEFEPKFERSKLEKVKLRQDYDDDSHREKKCPMFTNEGIEGLLYVEDHYRKVGRLLGFIDEQWFDQWEEVLNDNAEEKWETQTSSIAVADRTEVRFNIEVQNFYRKYCDEDARDVMFQYLSKVKKSKKTTPQDFADRMETLYRFANRLPGTEPLLNAANIKKRIFKGFSLSHQKHYLRSRDLATETLQQVVQFMENEKAFADNDERSTKRRSDNDSGGQAKRMRGGGDKKGKNKPKPHDPCPFHHGHK